MGFLVGNRARNADDSETTRGKTDGYDRHLYYTDADFDVVDAVKAVAANHGVKPAQIALAWMLNKPEITSPIIGSTKLYQLEEAIAALDIKLSDEEIEQLEAPYQPKPTLGHS